MRALRPRRLEQVMPLTSADEPADLIDTFSRLSAWSFMEMFCDFSVTWICGAPVQFTFVMVPTIEYTLEDSAKLGGAGAGAGSGLGVADTVDVVAAFASGSVLRSILRPASEGDLTGAFPIGAGAGAAAGCGREDRATRSPVLSVMARLPGGS